MATLIRRVPVRVLDVSAAGCQFEAMVPVHPGLIGHLRLDLEDGPCQDDVRVTRCQPVAGTRDHFRLGVELLSTRPLEGRSVRVVVREAMRRSMAAVMDPSGPADRERRLQLLVDSLRFRDAPGARPPPHPIDDG